jgi:hypothetical protein
MNNPMEFIFPALLLLGGLAAPLHAGISREDLFSNTEANFPQKDCASPFPFQTCFGVDQQTCETSARQALRACEVEMAPNIPEYLDSPEDAGAFGMWLGQCMDVHYAAGLASRKTDDSRCKAALDGDRVWSREELTRFRNQVKLNMPAPHRNHALMILAALVLSAAGLLLVLRRRRRSEVYPPQPEDRHG